MPPDLSTANGGLSSNATAMERWLAENSSTVAVAA